MFEHEVSVHYECVAERLKKWDAKIDTDKLILIDMQSVTWNDGSLGCPLPGYCYTQALVPGFILLYQYGTLVIEVHTDRTMQRVALPEIGFI